MKINNLYIQNYFLIVVLWLFYLVEALNKLFIFHYNFNSPIVKVVKVIIVLFALFAILKNGTVSKQRLYFVALMPLFFSIGQANLDPSFNEVVTLNFFRYLFPIVLLLYVNEFRIGINFRNLLFRNFEKIVFFNSVLIICGLVFGIHYFKTYPGTRFGYNGLLVTSATSTYFYAITVVYYLFRYSIALFNSTYRIIVFVSILFVGTKSLYLFFALIFIIYALLYAPRRFKILFFSFSLMTLLFFYYFFIEMKDFSDIDFMGSISSSRTLILKELMLPFINENWGIQNYLFGGINNIVSRPQMGVFDMFYFLGIIGTIFYLWIFKTSYFVFKVTPIQMICFIIIGLTIFVSGNFFLNTSVVIYLLIMREFLWSTSDDNMTKSIS